MGSLVAYGDEKKVLVIHSYHAELSWTSALKLGIDEGFRHSTHQAQVFHEYLDAKRYPQLQYQQAFLQYIGTKYRGANLDLLMVSDDPALSVVLENALLDPMPIVFLGINQVRPVLLNNPRMTGVFENHSVAETAFEAIRQMGTDTLIVLTDSSHSGHANLRKILDTELLQEAPVLIAVNDVVDADIAPVFAEFPKSWPVMMMGQLRRGSAVGPLVPFEEGTRLLRAALDNPIYSETSMHLGQGAVGGKMLDGAHHAEEAVKLAVELMDGRPVRQVPPILHSNNHWMFDARELRRFGIPQDELPADSEIHFAEASFYQRNRLAVWITSGVILVAMLVIALLAEVIRRRAIAATLLMENRQRYKDLAEVGADVFWELDCNLRLTHMSGQLPRKLRKTDMLGKTYKEIYRQLSNVSPDLATVEKLLESRKRVDGLVYQVVQANERPRFFRINGKAVFDGVGRFVGYRGNHREITMEHELHQKLQYRANHDQLTGLINRSKFDIDLKMAFEKARQTGKDSVLCYLDLDQFKVVNDTAGHLAGDHMLAEIAKLLRRAVPRGACLGRLGGDEFGLILEDCPLAEGQKACQALVDQVVAYRFVWEKRWFSVGVSIGIVPMNRRSSSTTELLSKADMACYRAKDLGRARVYTATEKDLELAMRQDEMNWLADISQAFEEGRFYLVRQAIQPVQPEDLEHVEILLRLRGDNGENISPDRFIPVAERHGLIRLIDRWVVATMVQQYRHLFPDSSPVVSINLSGVSLSDDRFLGYVQNIIQVSDFDPSRLCFEITETAAISYLNQVRVFIGKLKAMGVRFALDDFGSGVSSFEYLRNLPVDYLKIDGCLVRSIVEEPYDLEIVTTVNRLAQMMDIQTVAEYVENPAIAQVLREVGVDYLQGFAIEEPVALPMPIRIPTARMTAA